MDSDLGQDSLRRHRLVPSVRTTVELIWLAGAQPRRRCPSRSQTMLTVLTQTPAFVSGSPTPHYLHRRRSAARPAAIRGPRSGASSDPAVHRAAADRG